MECYSKVDLTTDWKELDIYKGDFYMIYPVLKQIVVAFGEGQQDRLGLASTSNTSPKACYSTKNLNPQKIYSSFSHSAFVDENK